MPWTVEQLQDASYYSLDNYLKNQPVDQVGIDRPWIKFLMAGKKPKGGGKQFLSGNIRTGYGSNGQWYYGDNQVTYNKRRNVRQYNYPWKSLHDGLSYNEDELEQNGVAVHADRGKSVVSKEEKVQLASFLDDQNVSLKEGVQQFLDEHLHLDGTQDPEAPMGLDGLVSLTPSAGTIGGIAASNAYWQNRVRTGLTIATTTGTIVDEMESMWRECLRNAKTAPTHIFCGSDFWDAYVRFTKKTYGTTNYMGGKTMAVEAGTPMDAVTFMGVPLVWNPVFQELDTTYSPATPWEKRCYFINKRHMWLSPLNNHDMIVRNPPRVYDRYTIYQGITFKGTPICDQRNAHGVAAIA